MAAGTEAAPLTDCESMMAAVGSALRPSASRARRRGHPQDVHAAAVITTLGAALDGRSFPATAEGYRQLVSRARSFGGIAVTEVNQPDKAARRRHGKTDVVDAEAAARAVLSGRATATAKTSNGPVEMLRLFKLAKGSAVKSRTQAINQLKRILVCADTALRESWPG